MRVSLWLWYITPSWDLAQEHHRNSLYPWWRAKIAAVTKPRITVRRVEAGLSLTHTQMSCSDWDSEWDLVRAPEGQEKVAELASWNWTCNAPGHVELQGTEKWVSTFGVSTATGFPHGEGNKGTTEKALEFPAICFLFLSLFTQFKGDTADFTSQVACYVSCCIFRWVHTSPAWF